MTKPPVPLGDHAAVQRLFDEIPVRARRRMVDLVVLAAGEDRQSAQIALLDDLPQQLPQHERARTLNRFWRRIDDELSGDVRCVAVGVCRLGHLAPAGEDLAWHDAIRATAGIAGLTCFGIFLCTPDGAIQILPQAA